MVRVIDRLYSVPVFCSLTMDLYLAGVILGDDVKSIAGGHSGNAGKSVSSSHQEGLAAKGLGAVAVHTLTPEFKALDWMLVAQVFQLSLIHDHQLFVRDSSLLCF